MSRLVGIVAAIAVAAVLAAPAAAKELRTVTVCGEGGCRQADHGLALLVEGGPPTTAPPAAERERSYLVHVAVEVDQGRLERFSMRYFPDARAVRGASGTWIPMSSQSAAVYRDVTVGLEPFGGSGGRSLPWRAAGAGVGLFALAGLALLVIRPFGRRPSGTLSGRSA